MCFNRKSQRRCKGLSLLLASVIFMNSFAMNAWAVEKIKFGAIEYEGIEETETSVPAYGEAEESEMSVYGETEESEMPTYGETEKAERAMFDNGRIVEPRALTYIYGDIDGDGDIAVFDALEALRAVVRILALDELQQVVADVDANERIEAADALLILQYCVKLVTQFPAEGTSGLRIYTDNFIFDSTDECYYVNDVMDTISGSLRMLVPVKAFYWTITDENKTVVASSDLEPKKKWEAENVGFIVGKNYFTITVEYEDGVIVTESICVYNLVEENMEKLSLDYGDTDGDGVLNYLEELHGTDSTKADTDEDMLDDYQEIAVFGTDPLNMDSDGDGIYDSQEDFDEDGVINSVEIELGSEPFNRDTDGDGLLDGKEVEIGTDIFSVDTDLDNGSDGWEIENGFDPLVTDESFDMRITSEMSGNVTASVEVSLTGQQAQTVVVEARDDDDIINSRIPGYIGKACDVSVEGDFSSADISFSIPKEYQELPRNEFDPVIYYYNEETQLLEAQETRFENGTATATVTHFSTYILLNRVEFDKVWEKEIKLEDDTEDGIAATIDIAFVIDYSASMSNNDPNGIRKELTKSFISKLREDTDRASVIKFAAYATTLVPMSYDKEMLCNAVDGIVNNGGSSCDSEAGTNGSDGLKSALDTLEDSKAGHQYIVFLTDGEDTTTSYDYDELTAEAASKGIVIYTIGLGEANESLLQFIASSTGGKYYYTTSGEIEDDSQDGLDYVFEQIQDETIDRQLDSNKDGISDYYTKLMCDGMLTMGTGTCLFPLGSYEKVQQTDDYDGDGLKNGEEVTIATAGEKVYMKVRSFPNSLDSDYDTHSDYEEVKTYGTHPLTANSIIDKKDVEWLTDSEQFVSDKYKDFYDNKYYGWAERGSVWIGNNIFGTEYDVEMLYQSILVEYFEQLNKELEKDIEMQNAMELARSLTEQVVGALDQYYGEIADKGDDYQKMLDDTYEMVKRYEGSWLNRSSNGFESVEDYYKYCDELYDTYRKASNEAAELEDKLALSHKMETKSKVTSKIGFVLTAADIAIDFKDAFDEYVSFVTNMETIQQNIYILDVLIENSEEDKLVEAAENMRSMLNDKLEDSLQCFFESPHFRAEVASTGGKFLHELLGAIPYVKYAELFVSVSDFVFNLSGVAKECSRLYAISTWADLLAGHYEEYLSTNNKLLLNEFWRDYTNPGTTVKRLTDLAVMRFCAERQMKAADYENTFLMEWLFTKIMYKVSECDANCTKVEELVSKYQGQRIKMCKVGEQN